MRIGKISKRPASISKHKSSFDGKEKAAKLPIGPTISSPGPTLFKQADTEVNDVTKSNSSTAVMIRIETAKIRIYTIRKEVVLRTVS